MLAKGADEIPATGEWRYEPKWDGFRAIAFVEGATVNLQSRNTQPLSRYFPEVVEAIASAVTGDCILDGEIVLATGSGLEFDVLQNRLHPAESRVRRLAAETPARFVAFDLLGSGDRDLRGLGLDARREQLLGALTPSPSVAITPQTDDATVAERWFREFEGAGLDGIVAKPARSTYQPGVRGWIKVKHLRTIDAVVGGYRIESKGDGVASLLLGLYDGDGVLHHVGHTSSFNASEKRRLRTMLADYETGAESFGHGRTPGSPSRWSKGRDTEWVGVRPELVVEVSFDHMQGPRFRHAARLLRWRDDKAPAQCTFDQLDRPEDFDLGAIITAWGGRA